MKSVLHLASPPPTQLKGGARALRFRFRTLFAHQSLIPYFFHTLTYSLLPHWFLDQ